MQNCVVYITAPNHETAVQLARSIVEERLAACANIINGVTSVYWWDQQLQQDDEVVLIAKTRSEYFEPLKQRVLQLHPYDCPAIVAWPIDQGHADYLQWIVTETAPSTSP